MKKVLISIILFFSVCCVALAQSYEAYFTGSQKDVKASALGGICLMGGSTESDPAMRWFLERAGGGDILVLRASGSDGYNDYFYSELGVPVNSVETIVCLNKSCADETYIHEKIKSAEAIWFAGGNQWNYVNYWRGTEVEKLINEGLETRNIVIGGTSAGMAILGGYYFSAEKGTINTEEVLSNPVDNRIIIDSSPFLKVPFLENVITDTHYSERDRQGRHVGFLAAAVSDQPNIKGIACDESTAVCIAPDGEARVFGDFPEYDDTAYFIQINCESSASTPETREAGRPLTWQGEEDAIKVYAVKGTKSGLHSFSLSNWEEGNGGEWQHWYVRNGQFRSLQAEAINCSTTSTIETVELSPLEVRTSDTEWIIMVKGDNSIKAWSLFDTTGRMLLFSSNLMNKQIEIPRDSTQVDVSILRIETTLGTYSQKLAP